MKYLYFIIGALVLGGCATNKEQKEQQPPPPPTSKDTAVVEIYLPETTKTDTTPTYFLPEIKGEQLIIHAQSVNERGWSAYLLYPRPQILFQEQKKVPFGEDSLHLQLTLYKRGKLTSGKFKNAQYYVMLIEQKGNCLWYQHLLRMILYQDTLRFLLRCSSPSLIGWKKMIQDTIVRFSSKNLIQVEPFDSAKVFIVDKTYLIGDLAINPVAGPYVLKRTLYDIQWQPKNYLKEIGRNFYTSKDSCAIASEAELISKQFFPQPLSIDSASKKQFLCMHAFYRLQSDGAVLVYAYPWQRLQFQDTTLKASDYVFFTSMYARCQKPYDYACVVQNRWIKRYHLQFLCTTNRQDSVFIPTRYNTEFLDKLYQKYLKHHQWAKGKGHFKGKPHSFEQFIKSRPILFLKDAHGRWIRAYRKQYLPLFYAGYRGFL